MNLSVDIIARGTFGGLFTVVIMDSPVKEAQQGSSVWINRNSELKEPELSGLHCITVSKCTIWQFYCLLFFKFSNWSHFLRQFLNELDDLVTNNAKIHSADSDVGWLAFMFYFIDSMRTIFYWNIWPVTVTAAFVIVQVIPEVRLCKSIKLLNYCGLLMNHMYSPLSTQQFQFFMLIYF